MSLEAEALRGKQAQEVIDNPIYAEAWTALEQGIIEQWRAARNPADREQLHQLLLMHEQARTALESVMRTGELARAELARKLSRAEQMAGARFKPRSAA